MSTALIYPVRLPLLLDAPELQVPLLILVLNGATQTVKCWQTASSILLNAHCYFVSVREEGQSAHPKSE